MRGTGRVLDPSGPTLFGTEKGAYRYFIISLVFMLINLLFHLNFIVKHNFNYMKKFILN